MTSRKSCSMWSLFMSNCSLTDWRIETVIAIATIWPAKHLLDLQALQGKLSHQITSRESGRSFNQQTSALFRPSAAV